MKLLILSDLHYNIDNDNSLIKEQLLKDLSEEHKFDAVILCGDNAVPNKDFSNHLELFKNLKSYFDTNIAFVCGNHDLWTKQLGISSEKVLYEIFNDISKDLGLIHLEKDNLEIKDKIIAGTYGHYDYSLARMSDIVTRKAINRHLLIYQNSHYPWMDNRFLDFNGKTNSEFCTELINKLDQRLDENKDIILISHTVPHYSVMGRGNDIDQDFYAAYSGTDMFLKLYQKYNIEYHFFGHTHAPSIKKFNNTLAVNVGADLKDLSYIILQDKEIIRKSIKI
ncbi:metallophosphoesterase [Nanoarchaeota archaeon]